MTELEQHPDAIIENEVLERYIAIEHIMRANSFASSLVRMEDGPVGGVVPTGAVAVAISIADYEKIVELLDENGLLPNEP